MLILCYYDDIEIYVNIVLDGSDYLNKLPLPERSGYTFLGWTNEIDGELFNSTSFAEFLLGDAQKQIYAVWQFTEISGSFLGTWVYSDELGTYAYAFYSDGSFNYEFISAVESINNCAIFGTYYVEDSNIVVLTAYTDSEISGTNGEIGDYFAFDTTYCSDGLLIGNTISIYNIDGEALVLTSWEIFIR